MSPAMKLAQIRVESLMTVMYNAGRFENIKAMMSEHFGRIDWTGSPAMVIKELSILSYRVNAEGCEHLSNCADIAIEIISNALAK